jgi:ParB family chromosome partitioning protein
MASKQRTSKASMSEFLEVAFGMPGTAKTENWCENLLDETGPLRSHMLKRLVRSNVPVRLLKRDFIFVLEKLVDVLDEPRIETLARQHGIRQKRDEGGIAKTLLAFMRRADEGTLSRLTVDAAILLSASRHNGASAFKDAATLYKVDTDAIAQKVKQEFTAKAKAKKEDKPVPKTNKAA